MTILPVSRTSQVNPIPAAHSLGIIIIVPIGDAVGASAPAHLAKAVPGDRAVKPCA